MTGDLHYLIQDLGERKLRPARRGDRGLVFATGVRALSEQLNLPRSTVLNALEGIVHPAIAEHLQKKFGSVQCAA